MEKDKKKKMLNGKKKISKDKSLDEKLKFQNHQKLQVIPFPKKMNLSKSNFLIIDLDIFL